MIVYIKIACFGVFLRRRDVSHNLRGLDELTRDSHETSILIWLGTEDTTDRRIVG
jgi:hypothetical protein